MVVLCLADASDDSRQGERPGIGLALEEELEFLAGTERQSIAIDRCVESRHDAHHTVVLLLFELIFGLLAISVLRGPGGGVAGRGRLTRLRLTGLGRLLRDVGRPRIVGSGRVVWKVFSWIDNRDGSRRVSGWETDSGRAGRKVLCLGSHRPNTR